MSSAQLTRAKALAPPRRVRVKFWGTRGSIPVSGTQYIRYGGNTSCVSITSDSGHLFILDAGSGIRQLGIELNKAAKNGGGPATGYLLISHSHWDHIQGFPFFLPAFMPNSQFSIIGCCEEGEVLMERLAGQMDPCYFPVALDSLPAALSFHALCEGQYELDGAELAVLIQRHTLPSTAFRLKIGHATIVYASDNEPVSPPVPGDSLMGPEVIDPEFVEFARGADILIHDSQYTVEEYATHIGWGHNIAEAAVDTAIKAGIKRVALFHHDPIHSDDDLDSMLDRARNRARQLGATDLEVISSYDGLEIEL